MNDGAYLGPYICRRKLIIPQGQIGLAESGKSSLKQFPGDVFSFDGDEPIEINMLLRSQAIMPYTKPVAELEAK